MRQFVTRLGEIDDLGKTLAPRDAPDRIASEDLRRRRPTLLSRSDLMTILVDVHTRHGREVNAHDIRHLPTHRRSDVPPLVRDSRWVEWMSRALVPWTVDLLTRQAPSSGMAFLDSTPLARCPPRRPQSPPVLDGLAPRGQTSMGGWDGGKLPRLLHDQGERIRSPLPPGNVEDRPPGGRRSQGLTARFFGERGDRSQKWHDERLGQGLALLTRLRQTLPPPCIRWADQILLTKRREGESVHEPRKPICPIEPTRPRRVTGWLVTVLADWIASTHDPPQPSLGVPPLMGGPEMA